MSRERRSSFNSDTRGASRSAPRWRARRKVDVICWGVEPLEAVRQSRPTNTYRDVWQGMTRWTTGLAASLGKPGGNITGVIGSGDRTTPGSSILTSFSGRPCHTSLAWLSCGIRMPIRPSFRRRSRRSRTESAPTRVHGARPGGPRAARSGPPSGRRAEAMLINETSMLPFPPTVRRLPNLRSVTVCRRLRSWKSSPVAGLLDELRTRRNSLRPVPACRDLR